MTNVLLHKLILGDYGPGGWWRCKLPLEALQAHVYVVGVTRKGKSKFLEHLAYQLIALGQGVAVLDPHADLADSLLARLAPLLRDQGLADRTIYFDPSRSDYLLPFNVLSSPGEPYAIAQGVLEAFRRTWPESLKEAPRASNILLAATMALVENRLPLTALPRFLTDAAYRHALLSNVADPEVTAFFRTRYDRWGREQAIIAEAVLNKVGALTLNPALRLILGQKENALSFRQIMDEGRVLILDLGRADAETRRLLGSLMVVGLEQAALSRADIPAQKRKPFYLILDEFQDYCLGEGSEQTLSHLLSECRKFGLHLILAHQSQSQLSPALHGALENAQLRVVFGVGRGTAQAVGAEMFRAALDENKSTLAEQWEAFYQRAQGLGQRQILVQLPEQGGIKSLRTHAVPEAKITARQLEALKRKLLKRWGRPVASMRRALEPEHAEADIQPYESIEGGPHA